MARAEMPSARRSITSRSRSVNLAIGSGPLSQCSAFDTDLDGVVTINEVILAVNNALTGCTAG